MANCHIVRHDRAVVRHRDIVDADFLTPSPAGRDRVRKLAQVLGGAAAFPGEHAMTALVGQAYRFISDEDFLNVDVLWDVLGMDADAIRDRAVTMEIVGGRFLVMHPMHVLRSRLFNLYKLRAKQNDVGRAQLRAAIDVVREYIRAEARVTRAAVEVRGRSPIQHLVSEVERMAVEDAGRKVAKRDGIHVADAIDPSMIPAGPFWSRRWPAIRELMSPAYRAAIVPKA